MPKKKDKMEPSVFPKELSLPSNIKYYSELENGRRVYKYEPSTHMALGLSFDPCNLTDDKLACIDFIERHTGQINKKIDVLYVNDFQSLSKLLNLDQNASVHSTLPLSGNLSTTRNQTNESKFSEQSINILIRAYADYGAFTMK